MQLIVDTELLTADLFLATLEIPGQQDSSDVCDIFVCQPYQDLAQMVVPDDDTVSVLNALSHLSLIRSNNHKLLTDYKG